MTQSILLTQCLQNDFVAHVQPHDPLPNRLHVGQVESLRLLGPDPKVGPIGQLMANIRALPEDTIEVIHIRDWHDPNDASQRDHLETFGQHCIRDTVGARLVINLEGGLGSNERILDSGGLSDFEGTSLSQILAQQKSRAMDAPLRVGVVGVWTEAKVTFLLYDLKTRLGINELATCSALTASASRAQHFNAIEQLSRILGVRCFDSVGEFVSWLAPDGAQRLPPIAARFEPKIELSGEGIALSEIDRDIIGYLYRDSAKIKLSSLSGGFSGALVFRASAHDAWGHQQAPSVIKVGPHSTIGKERVAFERVEEILGNNAPSVRGFVDYGERAGIKYSYAAMGQGPVRTFKGLFESGCPQPRIDAILSEVFEHILGQFYVAAKYERLPILEHYGFSTAWAASVRELVGRLVGNDAVESVLSFPGGYRATNVCKFYEEFLQRYSSVGSDFHYVSYVHGDLNGANILIDGRDNVWTIDFFHTARGHILKDLAKLENDVKYIMTPVNTEEELEEALLITRALRQVADLRAPLPELLDGLQSPQLLRAWATIRTLRRIVGQLCAEDRHPVQMAIALLRYAVHTLSFDESTTLQKRWALADACGHGEDAMMTSEQERALRVDWLESPRVGTKCVGMTLCPGRRDRGRALGSDLLALKAQGTTHLLCLLTDEELAWAGIPQLREAAEAHFTFRQAPIADQSVPSLDDAAGLATWCLSALAQGGRVVIHCMGGLGRTGTIAACVLTSRGASCEEAMQAVRAARGPRAIETKEQEAFVAEFDQRAAQARIQPGSG